ncbi:MAG: phosphoenolpyruvate--protein phosphotransferase [Paracoccaceae bacterium]|nr:phosphoenolpyruvate--protein phosphotransferase [Paracoccaceae bacterium]MDE2914806.1 phosphoenolpyruvate--protein phosphotransferase [Paracoccaceae bacterium]
MPDLRGDNSRELLKNLRNTLARVGDGQARLDRITRLIAEGMGTDVCSIYLCRDERTLELCATQGLNPGAVHKSRLHFGEGLVGRVAAEANPINTANAAREKGFRFMPETDEQYFNALLGVPIQRLGSVVGVLVVQSRESRLYSDDEIYALEVIAMVIAEMQELGAFTGEGRAMSKPHQRPLLIRGISGQEGATEGVVFRHELPIVISEPVADDPEAEKRRLLDAIDRLRISIDDLLSANMSDAGGEQREVMKAYRMFANSRGWVTRLIDGIDSGLAAEVAVEKEQSATRARMARAPDPYLRSRLHDLDDLSNRLLRLLTEKESADDVAIPDGAILVARNIGPGDLLSYGKALRGIVLEEGSVGSHATIIARAWSIPVVLHAETVTIEAMNGDVILVDGDQGLVHLRPEETVKTAFHDKIAMQAEAQEAYAALRTLPAVSTDGIRITMHMNAGLMVDLPSLVPSGAEGVGLFRTELQFLIRNAVPKRDELARLYSGIMDSARGLPVYFRTLDIGSDKVLPYMNPEDEPNPAMGWRAVRITLDRPGIMRMQVQALLRATKGRPLWVMFPMIAQFEEFKQARQLVMKEVEKEKALGHKVPEEIRIGAMLETPSLAFAADRFFELTDFISIGGNDLKQFFFAADRQNERVRRRYDTLNVSFLSFIRQIADRCDALGTPVGFCGEDAGRPLEAVCIAAMGLRSLSMRPASIGPVKHLLRKTDLGELRSVIQGSMDAGNTSVRPAVTEWMGSNV